ncbi:hypothetical protein ACRALDRAFT_2038025 [Sodiomyces alcalophilus JCM 7366]|uniref:uncharacterized protein n=1 Tax=Sodiomyces alcalophilus JCM 7366 TaxID=591952 RepID=UPI0039B68460
MLLAGGSKMGTLHAYNGSAKLPTISSLSRRTVVVADRKNNPSVFLPSDSTPPAVLNQRMLDPCRSSPK